MMKLLNDDGEPLAPNGTVHTGGDAASDGDPAPPSPRSRSRLSIHLPSNRDEVYSLFNLSRTNQILQGHSPTAPNPRQRKGKKGKKRASTSASKKANAERKRWVDAVASELFSSRISVSPRPSESNASAVPTDPSRGRYMTARDFGAPYGQHLCKMVRSHLLGSIMARYDRVKPRVNTNLGKRGKPTKKELERWKIRRAKKLQKRRRKKVVSTKKKKKRLQSARLKKCATCGDFHFRRSCGVRDARINLMVKQIYQKAEVIKENMGQVWDKIDNLENAYHDMLMKVHRLQSNRVCLGLLTGTDYPGECHPHNCPCVEQKVKEEKDRKRQEERRREEQQRKKEEAEKRERERQRRERIIESRKKRFYSRMQQQRLYDVATAVRFQSSTTATATGTATSGEESEGEDGNASLQLDTVAQSSVATTVVKKATTPEEAELELLKKGQQMTSSGSELTRLEASRRKTRLSLLDDDDLLRKPSRPSLLLRAVERTRRESAQDLIVMDGHVKTVSETIIDTGGMIAHELRVEEYPFDDGADTSDDVDQLSEIGEVDEIEEEEAPLPEEPEPEEEIEEEKAEEKPTMPFGEFLDLMEVF